MPVNVIIEVLNRLNSEDWFYLISVFVFFIWGIAIFLFGRITVKHIEREMAKESLLPPEWDKGIGARMIAYAGIIAFPNLNRHASLVNIEATKRYSRKKDKKFAWFYLVTTVSIFIMLIVFSIFFAPDDLWH